MQLPTSESLVFLWTRLFRFSNRFPELFDSLHFGSVQCVLRHVPPDGRLVQGVLDPPPIDLEDVVRWTNLIGNARSFRLRPANAWIREIRRTTSLNADTNLVIRLLDDNRPVIGWRIPDCWTVRVSLRTAMTKSAVCDPSPV